MGNGALYMEDEKMREDYVKMLEKLDKITDIIKRVDSGEIEIVDLGVIDGMHRYKFKKVIK